MIKITFNGSRFTADAEQVRQMFSTYGNPLVEVDCKERFIGTAKSLADAACTELTTLLGNGVTVSHRGVFPEVSSAFDVQGKPYVEYLVFQASI